MRSRSAVKVGKLQKFQLILKSNISASEKAKQFIRIYGKFLVNIPIYIVLISLSVVFLVPFFYMIGHSMMSQTDIMNASVKWIPRHLNFNNYQYAFGQMKYLPYLGKSLLYVGIAVVGQIFSCSFIAYGLARINFKFKGLIFGLIIFLLIVPPQTIIVPNLIQYSNWHWVDTYLPIDIPCFFGMGLNGGLLIFVFRQFFRGMPSELESAALIDGTGVFGAYWRIIFPNASPAILITTILALVWQWNNYFEPSMYLKQGEGILSMQLSTLTGSFTSNTIQAVDLNVGVKMAGTFLVVLPVIVIFFALQGRFMKNLASSGLAN